MKINAKLSPNTQFYLSTKKCRLLLFIITGLSSFVTIVFLLSQKEYFSQSFKNSYKIIPKLSTNILIHKKSQYVNSSLDISHLSINTRNSTQTNFKKSLTNNFLPNRDELLSLSKAKFIFKSKHLDKDALKLCYYSNYCSNQERNENNKNQENECINGTHALSLKPLIRLVHFDLKGAPPKIEYVLKLLFILKKSGATGLLIEYEDMFPFWGKLSRIPSIHAYSLREIKKLLHIADLLKLEVVPLIQTFGHLEYVLKLPEFMNLRETNESNAALCPLNSGSFELVSEMIKQVMTIHTEAKWLHIGCDEVFHLALCNKCSKFIYKKDLLYLQHVIAIAKHVKKEYNVTPIIWDDMLRRISSRVLRKINIGSILEPMIWVYAEKVPSLFFPRMWQRYSTIFRNLWTASAFKGAFGRRLVIPNVKRHLNNHISWLAAMAKHNTMHFRGMAITGWQRYEHFAPLCELLPVGLPSLILNLVTITDGCFSDKTFKQTMEILNCSTFVSNSKDAYMFLGKDPYFQKLTDKCSFPGSTIFDLAHQFIEYNDTVFTFVKSICQFKERWNDKKAKTKFLEEVVDYKSKVGQLINKSSLVFPTVFSNDSTIEWINQNLKPLLSNIKHLQRVFNKTTSINFFCNQSFPDIKISN